MKSGIFGIRNRCCGRVDVENAGSWHKRMSVLLTSGLRFRFSYATCMGSVSIFFGLSGIIFHSFLTLAAVCVVIFTLSYFCGPFTGFARSPHVHYVLPVEAPVA